ncbi:hypothetical protein [Streptomyces macrosporus]|uniref:Uncharacterized protein n=1 Tax=Streptomyces macrosporus TaxID=44032 RepID=A0ABP5XES1_9ACTN
MPDKTSRRWHGWLDGLHLAAQIADVYDEILRRDGVAYARVPDSAVPAEVRAAAQAATAAYAPELGDVAVRFFGTGKDANFIAFRDLLPPLGRCRPRTGPNEIWLDASLTPEAGYLVAVQCLERLADGDESEFRTYEEGHWS